MNGNTPLRQEQGKSPRTEQYGEGAVREQSSASVQFPPGDLDDMIFFEELVKKHSER